MTYFRLAPRLRVTPMEVAQMMRPHRYRPPDYFIIGALAMAEAESIVASKQHNRGR